MEELFLPVLSHFQNGNFWTASRGRMRYYAAPDGEELAAQVWEGPWNQTDSEMEETRRFPLSEEGLEELRGWAAAWAGDINARPPRSLEEDIRRRDACRSRRAVETPEKSAPPPA